MGGEVARPNRWQAQVAHRLETIIAGLPPTDMPQPSPRTRRATARDRFAPPGRTGHAGHTGRTNPSGSELRPRRHDQRAARRWLEATGSLTARLRGLGPVTVEKLRQGHQALRPSERRLLGIPHGHVREVLLRVDGQPAVWARSVTPVGATRGAWRALRGLGNRPLAELLFADRSVHRAPLCARRLDRHAPGMAAMHRQWAKALIAAGLAPPMPSADSAGHAAPTWMRWSVFHRRGQPLLVQEAFAPWVLKRALPAQRA
jgi:chorismate--pyruvate lyase